MAQYALTQTVAPTTEPVALTEAKAHLRVYGNDDDALVTRLIVGARNSAEYATDRQIITATWAMRLDGFPCGYDPIYLPKGSLQSVTSIVYLDTDGASQTLATSVYRTGAYREPAEITLAYGQQWPSLRGVRDQVTVTYVCGYGAATAVPQLLKQAMLLDMGSMFEHREDVNVGSITSKLPLAAENIYKQFALGDEFHVYAHGWTQ